MNLGPDTRRTFFWISAIGSRKSLQESNPIQNSINLSPNTQSTLIIHKKQQGKYQIAFNLILKTTQPSDLHLVE